MFYRKTHGWISNLDILILSLVSLHLSLISSYYIHIDQSLIYENEKYYDISIIMSLIWILFFIIFGFFNKYKTDSYFNNLSSNVKQLLLINSLTIFYIFGTKQGIEYSRVIIFIYFPVFYIVYGYLILSIYKHVYLTFLKNKKLKKSLIIITDLNLYDSLRKDYYSGSFSDYDIKKIFIINEEPISSVDGSINQNNDDFSKKIEMGSLDSCTNYINEQWVEEALVLTDKIPMKLSKILEDLTYCGSTVHFALTNSFYRKNLKQVTNKFGSYITITTTLNYMNYTDFYLKRTIDIIGALVGCFITCILFVFIAPLIYLNSPGQIFYTQNRVGIHGKIFKLYKFRTMYVDADARKKDLEDQNLIKSGLMFKMEFDPRIIGNRILEDGTHKEGIGAFLRKLSLDEFPQFFNVLKGDMSIVGTRPPTIDEWAKYSSFHKSRLFIKPGITGLWQVSGRSTITDFNEVVSLDRKYIKEWSLVNDLKIILKTVKVVILHNDSY